MTDSELGVTDSELGVTDSELGVTDIEQGVADIEQGVTDKGFLPNHQLLLSAHPTTSMFPDVITTLLV